jgi:DNA polymerase-1
MIHSMATRGMQVDLTHFATMEKLLIAEMECISAEVQSVAGHYVNLGSGPQVATLLFKEMGLKQARTRMTKTGDRESVEHEVLVAIQHQHPTVAKILEYKKLDKLRGTYVMPIPKLAKKTAFGTWRVFPNFKATRIPSGRYAAKSPNLLAMPNRTEFGRRVCEGFITDPGWVYLSCDFSQLEPRIVAHRSQDPRLMAIYHNKEDIYSDFATASFALDDQRYQDASGWHYPTVHKKDHRMPGKICILSSIYRVSNVGLLEQLPTICLHCKQESSKHTPDCRGFESLWNEDNAQDLINSFYLRYRGITAMQRADDARVRKRAYTWDLFGRLQHITAVRSIHPWVVSAALREAGNLPIQGSATGCLKLAMAEIQDTLVESGMLGDCVWPLLPVHDEVLFEVRADMAEEIAEYVKSVFRNCVKLSVPLDASAAIAPSWGLVEK